jgi:FKBP12-rapamycin complex-associated protein
MLAAAVGPNLTKLLHDQLDLIFAHDFNEHVRNCLSAVIVSIPPLLNSIQGVKYFDFSSDRALHCF